MRIEHRRSDLCYHVFLYSFVHDFLLNFCNVHCSLRMCQCFTNEKINTNATLNVVLLKKNRKHSGIGALLKTLKPTELMKCAFLSGSTENMEVDQRSLFWKVSPSYFAGCLSLL